MNILDGIRGKAASTPTKPPLAPDIANTLAAAEAELFELEAKHGNLALDAMAGEPDAASRLATLTRDLSSARENVATLKAAHKAAVDRDEANIRAQRAALRKTQIAAMRKHLDARDAAAIALSASIADAARHYRTLLDRSTKARSACPIGAIWPTATDCEPDPIRRLVQYELFRLSATEGNQDGRALPGAMMLPGYQWQPAAIPPLVDAIKRGSEHAIAELAGKETD